MPPYQIIKFEQPIGSGVTGAMWASVRAVLKRNSAEDPYCVANELVCGQLSQFLGLPVPPCGLFLDPRSTSAPPWFGTLNFNLSGDTLPPADPDECVMAYTDAAHPRPDVVTGTLLFDIWVANGDRHQRNLALDTSVTPAQLHVFDHSWALFGRQGTGRLSRLMNELGIGQADSASGNRHCLLDAVKSNTRFRYWADRIGQIPDYVINDAIDGAFRAKLIGGPEAATVRSFLQFRRTHLVDIMNRCRAEFTGIPDTGWSEL